MVKQSSNINSTNVPETWRLCRGCKAAHYWDKKDNHRVADKDVPKHSFVEEAWCLKFKVEKE